MLKLVDTSIWVQHFRVDVPDLAMLLSSQEVVLHPVILGELAVGGLKKRRQTLADLRVLPMVPERPFDESLDLIGHHRWYGIGLSWGDVQLLAAALSSGIPIWTFDTTLQTQANKLGIAWRP